MPTVTERLAIFVEANAGKAIAEFKQLGDTAQTLGGTATRTGGLFQNMSTQAGALFGSGGALGAGIAAASVGMVALAGFVGGGVKGFLDLAKQVDDFRRTTGLTAEEASRLVAAFDDVGVEAGTAATSIFQLEKRLAANNSLLNSYGVTVARASDGTTDVVETLLKVGDAYKGTHDPAQKAALLTTAFGKSGAAIVPLLERTREDIEAMFDSAERTNQLFSSDDLLKARQYRESVDDLSDSFRGLQIEAGQGLVPFLTEAAGLATSLLQRINDIINGPPEGEGGTWNFIATVMHAGMRATGDLIGLLPGVGDAAADASLGVETLANDVDDLATAVQTAADADRALAASKRTLASDQRTLGELQEDYDKLLKQGAVNAEKVADAERALREARRSQGSATRAQSRAQNEYNDALAAFIALPTDTNADKLAEAKDKLADADDNLASANDRVTDTQTELDKAKAGDPDYQDKLADAKQKVADQTQRIADAEYNVGQKTLAAVTAHEAEEVALLGKASAAETLISKYATLIAQYPELSKVLGPQIGTLSEATKPGGAAGVPSGGLFGQPLPSLLPYMPGAPFVPGGGAGGDFGGTSGPVTNNVTVNVDGQVDPVHIAGTMMWALN